LKKSIRLKKNKVKAINKTHKNSSIEIQEETFSIIDFLVGYVLWMSNAFSKLRLFG
jgi:hypothetical protein